MSDICDNFYNVTMTGRICYIFMCIEKYLVTLYPNRNWKPVAKKMWQWTSHRYWTESRDIYSEAVPEYILEFNSFDETNEKSYDGKLKKEDYDEIVKCFSGITKGNEEDEICKVLMIPIDFGNIFEGSSIFYAEPYVQELIKDIERILSKHNIPLPEKSKLKPFIYDRGKKRRIDEKEDGWGEVCNTEYLSIILN